MKLVKMLLITVSLLYSTLLHSQIGINIDEPHKSAVFQIESEDRGLLIPRISNLDLISDPANGLVVYNTLKKAFYLFDGNNWKIMLPFAIVNDTTISTNYNLQTSGNLTARSYDNNAAGNGPVPKGGIIMWSGSIDQIPQGWALCDGKDGKTPDLRDRFIVGAGGRYKTQDQGGKDTVALSLTQMPRHDHGGGYHTHTLITYNDIWCCDSNHGLHNPGTDYSDGGEVDHGALSGSGRTINIEGGRPDSPLGSSVGHENRPPYYALAYIMKL